MSWTCRACGTNGEDTAQFCVACGTPRAASDGDPTVPVVIPTPAAPSPTPPPSAPAPGGANANLPPIAGPPPTTTPPDGPGRSGVHPGVVVAIVAVIALAALAAGLVLGRGGGDDDAAQVDTEQDGGQQDERDGGSVDRDRDEDQATTTEATTTTRPTTTRPPTTTSPPTTTTLAAGVGRMAVEPYDRWITILHSREKATYSQQDVLAEADAMAASVGGDPRLVVLDSDASAVMNGGYWVIALIDFDTREGALSGCDLYAIPVGDCYPRQTLTGER